MSNKIMEMTDDELVSHYRDMQCLSVDTSTKEGLDNLRYYQGIVRQMARRFAILVENREIEDEPEQKTQEQSRHDDHRTAQCKV